MSLADGIVLLMVACAAVAVLRFMRNQKKAGKTACGCGSCSLLRPGETGVVRRVSGAADTRRFLADLGFVDGSQVRVVSELCGNMIIHIKDSRVAVNKEMAKHIMV